MAEIDRSELIRFLHELIYDDKRIEDIARDNHECLVKLLTKQGFHAPVGHPRDNCTLSGKCSALMLDYNALPIYEKLILTISVRNTLRSII